MRLLWLLWLLLAAALAGCASSGDTDPRDPFEGLNRGVYKFNETFDEVLAKPVARAYKGALHVEIRTRVSNFFANIQDIFIGVNNMLQGKLQEGVEDWARFAFNTTIGLGGIHDVASDMGLEKHNEDFGQTFGRWGFGDGPYLVLPFLGPSTLRDGGGLVLDFYTDPMSHIEDSHVREPLWALRLVSRRAELLDASGLLEEAALDRYIFLRDAYLQRRRSLVYDGSPPREREVNDTPDPSVK